jgi:hypothetical protein
MNRASLHFPENRPSCTVLYRAGLLSIPILLSAQPNGRHIFLVKTEILLPVSSLPVSFSFNATQ